jgi:hypothetical protein
MGRGPLRKLVIDGQPFGWRFDEVLVVIPGNRSGPPLYVDWGWRDWLEPDGPGAEPRIVTPRFVAEAVRFATAFNWPSAGNGPPLRLGFRDGRFLVVAPDARISEAVHCNRDVAASGDAMTRMAVRRDWWRSSEASLE